MATLLLCGAQKARAQARPADLPPGNGAPPAANVAPPVAGEAVPVYTLSDCIRIAYEKQPAICAARASLAAKEITRNGIANTPNIACLLVPDLKIRKEQACRGVSAAQGLLIQAEFETRYAVIRTYYTAIYAQLQVAVAEDVADNLRFYRKTTNDFVQAGDPGQNRDINQQTVDRLDVYLRLTEARKVEAEEGVQRALAALREAMGIGLECTAFRLADVTLPEPPVVPEKCDIVNLALARRGEVMAALVAADVVRLEIDAQGKHFLKPRVPTFASNSDIHGTQVPQGSRDPDYRPGAVPPEMPVSLAGNRRTRVDTAAAYSSRADAVVAKTRDLVALEAEDGYLRWLEAKRKAGWTREGAAAAKRLSADIRFLATNNQRLKPDEFLTVDVLKGQAIGSYHESVLQQLIALANLERITAGGFNAGLAD